MRRNRPGFESLEITAVFSGGYTVTATVARGDFDFGAWQWVGALEITPELTEVYIEPGVSITCNGDYTRFQFTGWEFQYLEIAEDYSDWVFVGSFTFTLDLTAVDVASCDPLAISWTGTVSPTFSPYPPHDPTSSIFGSLTSLTVTE